jgi:hypothetical protein
MAQILSWSKLHLYPGPSEVFIFRGFVPLWSEDLWRPMIKQGSTPHYRYQTSSTEGYQTAITTGFYWIWLGFSNCSYRKVQDRFQIDPSFTSLTSLKQVWNLSGTCLEPVWNLYWPWNQSGTCLEPVWNLSGTCLEPVWTWFRYFVLLFSHYW